MTLASCRVFVIACVLVAAALFSFAPSGTLAGTTGTLAGFVFAKNRAPIKGARVSATSPSQTAMTTTDETGHFVFASLIPDDYTVTASSEGYQASSQPGVLVSADATQQIEFALEPAVKTLARVTVSETAAGLLKPGTTQSMYTVTPSLQRTLAVLGGGTSLNQAYSAISAVPGAFVPPGQTGWNQPIFLRGGDFNEVGYELDGIPLNRAFDNLPTTSLSTNGQQQLQVYTGGAPADAESHGVAGYINQVIKTGTVPGFADASLGFGSPAMYNKVSIEGGSDNRPALHVLLRRQRVQPEFSLHRSVQWRNILADLWTAVRPCQCRARTTEPSGRGRMPGACRRRLELCRLLCESRLFQFVAGRSGWIYPRTISAGRSAAVDVQLNGRRSPDGAQLSLLDSARTNRHQ